MHYSTSLLISSLSLLNLATGSIASPIFKRGYERGSSIGGGGGYEGGLNGLSGLGDSEFDNFLSLSLTSLKKLTPWFPLVLGLDGGGSSSISPSFLSTLDLSKLSQAQRAQLLSALHHSASSKDKVKFNEKDFNELEAKNRLKVNEDDNERNSNQEEREKLIKELEEKEKEGRGEGGILRKRTFGDFYGRGGGGIGGYDGGLGGEFGGGGRESESGSGFEEGRFEEIGRGQGFRSGEGEGGLYNGGLFDGGLYDRGDGGRGECGGFECRYIDKRGGEEFDGEYFLPLSNSQLSLTSPFPRCVPSGRLTAS